MFSTNDTDCPANRFLLKENAWTVANGWSASTVSTNNYQIFDTNKLRTYPAVAAEYRFKIAASTVASKLGARSVFLDIKSECTPSD